VTRTSIPWDLCWQEPEQEVFPQPARLQDSAGIQGRYPAEFQLEVLHGLGVFTGIPHPADLTERDLMIHAHKTVMTNQRSEH